jgi:hypothetical protein
MERVIDKAKNKVVVLKNKPDGQWFLNIKRP